MNFNKIFYLHDFKRALQRINNVPVSVDTLSQLLLNMEADGVITVGVEYLHSNGEILYVRFSTDTEDLPDTVETCKIDTENNTYEWEPVPLKTCRTRVCYRFNNYVK